MVVKKAKLKDRVKKKLFIIEAIALGAKKFKLAHALGINRQSIDNYLKIKEYFGLKCIIRGYSYDTSDGMVKRRCGFEKFFQQGCWGKER